MSEKRGNRSEFHSERNYNLQNWYFSVINGKSLKTNLLYFKKSRGQAFSSAEVQKSAREFSHGLNFFYYFSDSLYQNLNGTKSTQLLVFFVNVLEQEKLIVAINGHKIGS